MGYSMLGDVNSSSDLLDIMVASDEITISKICTANGSILITCRNGQISVSPRRSCRRRPVSARQLIVKFDPFEPVLMSSRGCVGGAIGLAHAT